MSRHGGCLNCPRPAAIACFDLGGKALLSEGQRQLIRRAAMLSAESERMEALAVN
jgi:hypothetical protein